VRIATGICESLEYIHGLGVVHRDLKPKNIMIGEGDSVKLIDFGIAASEGMRRLTFSNLSNAMGTPDYISPEQIKRKRYDGRSDIYALGVILFEMLTGQTPFNGPNPFAVMNDRLVNDPPPAREMNPEISERMQEILYRATERNLEDRFAGALEFAEALARPECVEVIDRAARQERKPAQFSFLKKILSYTMLLLSPLVIFTLILLAVRQELGPRLRSGIVPLRPITLSACKYSRSIACFQPIGNDGRSSLALFAGRDRALGRTPCHAA
jgi:serine/threonine-protein kinase